jgi:predicted ATPase
MALDQIEVHGFKSIESLSLELRPLNVLIGANGAGKSNFIALFRLLNEMVEGRFQLAVRKGGGAGRSSSMVRRTRSGLQSISASATTATAASGNQR